MTLKKLVPFIVTAGAVVVGTVAYVAMADRGWFNFTRPVPTGTTGN